MKLLSAMVAFALAMVALPALGDPTAAAEPGVLKMRVIVVYGRLDKPNAVIEYRTPTAAKEAGAAHEALRAAWVARLAPVPPSGPPAGAAGAGGRGNLDQIFVQ